MENQQEYENDYLKHKESYSKPCKDCNNKGILTAGIFCSCVVGMAEILMGVSAETDRILNENRRN